MLESEWNGWIGYLKGGVLLSCAVGEHFGLAAPTDGTLSCTSCVSIVLSMRSAQSNFEQTRLEVPVVKMHVATFMTDPITHRYLVSNRTNHCVRSFLVSAGTHC